jgi:hypothetical protein
MITPSPMSTLDLLVEHLRAPFLPAEIKFLPKSPLQRGDAWVCLALPYADKRMYEDRLNALVPGRWSTPAMTPLVAGNKLVIPVTLVICEIAHTDVGEAFLTSLSRKGEPREEENAATEAYSQAFRRACAQVGLGRYLYDLPKAWVPYDPQKRAIALSEEELRQLAERLYRKVGLLPASPAAEVKAATASRPGPVPVPPDQTRRLAQPASAHEIAGSTSDLALPQAPVQEPAPHMDEERLPTPQPAPDGPSVVGESNGNLREASAVISPYQRSWVERQLEGDPSRIARVCQFYQVETLDELSGQQTVDLVNRLFAQQAQERQRRESERGQRVGQPKGRKAVAR